MKTVNSVQQVHKKNFQAPLNFSAPLCPPAFLSFSSSPPSFMFTVSILPECLWRRSQLKFQTTLLCVIKEMVNCREMDWCVCVCVCVCEFSSLF